MNLHTGTVTFLFTDIEGSTKLWEAHPEAMQTALERHEQLLREAIDAAGGVVFKTIGDAFCAAFADAPAALAAATKAQFALFAESWPDTTPIRVRMALHTGLAQERDNDYFGPVLNRVARLLSVGHGGQTLLSIVTHELCRDMLPGSARLLDLGSHRLKDLERPEHVFQLIHPVLPDHFPPLKSLDNTPNNLPQQLTSFIGREKAITDVTALLGKTRLLTLTGSGGAGKTRLALQVAADRLDQYKDGAWQVELASIADPAFVAQTVAQVLGVKEETDQTTTQALIEHMRTKHLLLLLDNCEHVLSTCVPLVSALLRACPHVKVLATSREPLSIGGETMYRVPSLSLPTTQQVKRATPESLTQFEAVRLFIERGTAVKPDFIVTNANAPALAQLCYRLDGIPLALELAAARVRSLAIEQINDKLDIRFRLLTGGDRSALPRQQTLRALVDWSYALLSDTEKTLFGRLSVFAGGWTLESAESVCGFDPIEEWEVLDVLTSLVDKSLVVVDAREGADAGETRYRMLETLRQYGAEKRAENGENEATQRRFIHHFVALGEESESQLQGPEQLQWLNRLETDNDNLRATLDNCATETTPSAALSGLRLAKALLQFWDVRGYLTEGRAHLARALAGRQVAEAETLDVADAAAVKQAIAGALQASGVLTFKQDDDLEAREFLEESLALSREIGSKSGIANALMILGNIAVGHKDFTLGQNTLSPGQNDYTTARLLYEESLTLYRELGNKRAIALIVGNLGNIALFQGDGTAARSLFEESLAFHREIGNKSGIAIMLVNLGVSANNQGDVTAARSLYEESLAFHREIGNKHGIANTLFNLGNLSYDQGALAEARLLYEESLALSREIGNKHGIANVLMNLGDVTSGQGDYAAARPLLEEALSLCRKIGNNIGIALALMNLTNIASEQGNYTEARLLLEEGLSLCRKIGNKNYLAFSLMSMASLWVSDEGDAVGSATLLAAASALRESIRVPLSPTDQATFDATLAKAQAALNDEAAWTIAWATGLSLSWEQAVKFALHE